MSAFSGQIPTVINSRAAHALGTVANVNGEDFFPAAEMGDNNIISDLILLGINVNASDANGNSALHLAVLNNHFSTVELLLQNGAEINSTNSNQNTPLHLAVQKGFREIVEQLVLGGADGNAANSDGKSPLQIVEESLRQESSELASARKFQKVAKISEETLLKIAENCRNFAEIRNFLTAQQTANAELHSASAVQLQTQAREHY